MREFEHPFAVSPKLHLTAYGETDGTLVVYDAITIEGDNEDVTDFLAPAVIDRLSESIRKASQCAS